ncbi:sugar porter family MFS transporter [Dyella sp. A6]|uniref:sugar porter family MFS transporter n=1 Tax=Dyella aluminiiresistens TaxID=3069105 RepID=UPI002E76245A|nr:sugar porter family MFS transporter [Dyella sp. A6]
MNTLVLPVEGHAKMATVFIAIQASLAGLMFGLDIGVISGAEQFIKQEFAITDQILELIVSAMMAGATIGVLGAVRLSGSLGRRHSLMIGAALFVIGAALSALSPSANALIGARVVLGLGIGILMFAAPMYLAEIAPRQSRGAMISGYQLMLNVGILIAFLSDTAFSYSGSWRWMLGIIGIPGVLFLLGAIILPDSPRWLMMRGRREQAAKVLMRLRGDAASVEREVDDIVEQLTTPQRGWKMFTTNRNFRRAVGLGIVLQLMQQFTGINVVLYYAPRIFEGMGYATTEQMWFTALVGLINVVASLVTVGLIDRWGRRPILCMGFGFMVVALGIVGGMLAMRPITHGQQLFTVAMLLVFIAGFAMSAGPIIWTLCSEIQPLKGRDFGIGCSTITNCLGNVIGSVTFLSLLDGIGNANTFWLYAGLNLTSLAVTLLLVPETRGVTLEGIESRLMAGFRLRDIGR